MTEKKLKANLVAMQLINEGLRKTLVGQSLECISAGIWYSEGVNPTAYVRMVMRCPGRSEETFVVRHELFEEAEG